MKRGLNYIFSSSINYLVIFFALICIFVIINVSSYYQKVNIEKRLENYCNFISQPLWNYDRKALGDFLNFIINVDHFHTLSIHGTSGTLIKEIVHENNSPLSIFEYSGSVQQNLSYNGKVIGKIVGKYTIDNLINIAYITSSIIFVTIIILIYLRVINLNIQLREGKRRYSTIIENTTDIIMLTNSEQVILYISPSCEAILNEDANDLIGKKIFDLFPNNQSMWDEFIHESKEKSKDSGLEYKVKAKDGTVKWLSHSWKEAEGYSSYKSDSDDRLLVSILSDITEVKGANEKLVHTSRLAGMSEVATGVLHNVGNVLNSLNIGAEVIDEKIINTASKMLAKISPFIEENIDNIDRYLTQDQKGKLIPQLIISVNKDQEQENILLKQEILHLRQNVEHIKNIISVQQSLANMNGMIEEVCIDDLIEQAVQVNNVALERHAINLVKDYQMNTIIQTDRLKVLQILINLISNAKYALSQAEDKKIVIKIDDSDRDHILIHVIDTGVGIEEQNFAKIFQYGHTTRENGHGFGLHNSSLAAKDVGGELTVMSEGENKGATFTLKIPKYYGG